MLILRLNALSAVDTVYIQLQYDMQYGCNMQYDSIYASFEV